MNTTTLKRTVRLVIRAAWQMAVITMGSGSPEMILAGSPSGRIALHVLCAKRDHHFRWHWQGIAREFVKA